MGREVLILIVVSLVVDVVDARRDVMTEVVAADVVGKTCVVVFGGNIVDVI